MQPILSDEPVTDPGPLPNGRAVDDPVLQLLSNALDRQAESIDRLSREIPGAIDAAMTAIRAENARLIRPVLATTIMGWLLMAGLVGVSIYLDSDGRISINQPAPAADTP